MLTIDFIVSLIVIYGITRLLRAVSQPSKPAARPAAPRVPHAEPRQELRTPPSHGKIVDATFEEIE